MMVMGGNIRRVAPKQRLSRRDWARDRFISRFLAGPSQTVKFLKKIRTSKQTPSGHRVWVAYKRISFMN